MAHGKKLTPARRKRRWIGLKIADHIATKEDLKASLNELLPICKSWKIFDFKKQNSDGFNAAIIRVDRCDEGYVRNILSDKKSDIFSFTTSGKIGLVRERMTLGEK